MNPQIELARKVIETTNSHLFLTGKAGTGKTTFLRRLRSNLPKRMAVLAPTGIAAINAEGMTIHSFFQLSFAPYVPGQSNELFLNKMTKQKKKLIQSLDLLVIDEISMVRADLLDEVDESLRRIRHNSTPFGGIQLLLIGDLQQLSPVVKEDEWRLISQYYDTPYFFSSRALKSTDYITIELEKVYRQSDTYFLSLLAAVRSGQRDASLLNALNQRYIPHFVPEESDGYIRLVTHNRQAQEVNEAELEKLPGKAYTYHAEIVNKFPELSYPTDETLTLKEGAQVMFVKNDTNHQYVNGTIGHIVSIDKRGFQVETNEEEPKLIHVEKETWENTRYAIDEKTKEITQVVEGKFIQYPVKLAWAITIHKSQGLTFDRVMIDAALSFAHGQTYVALSRCRTLEGIVLSSPIPPQAIISDPHIEIFNKDMPSHGVDEQKLGRLQQAYSLHLLTELFTFEKERIAFAEIMRVFEEFLSRIYPETTQRIANHLRAFDLEVMGVASRFNRQYDTLVKQSQNGLADETLQERVRKGAGYFLTKLTALRELARTVALEVDNKETKKRLSEGQKLLLDALSVHISLLEWAEKEGFESNTYQDLRAKALLEVADTKKRSDKNGKKRSADSSDEQEKYEVPTEVSNPQLYYRLQTWRKQKADSLNYPAFRILHNRVLMALANYMPTNKKTMLKMPYMGKATFEAYGEDIIELIKQYQTDVEQGNIEKGETITNVERTGESTFETSLRLFREGLSPQAIAEKRDLAVSTIYAHLAKYVESGEIDLFKLVSPEKFERIKNYFATHTVPSDARLSELRLEIGEDITFSDLKISMNRLNR